MVPAIVVLRGNDTSEEHCRHLARQCLKNFGRLDIPVNNAAFQRTYADMIDISAEEWDQTFRTNIYAPFFSARAAILQMTAPRRSKGRPRVHSRPPASSCIGSARPSAAGRCMPPCRMPAARSTVLRMPRCYPGASAMEARSTISVRRTMRLALPAFPFNRSTSSLAAVSPRP